MIIDLIRAFVEAAIVQLALPRLPRMTRISGVRIYPDGSVAVDYLHIEPLRWSPPR